MKLSDFKSLSAPFRYAPFRRERFKKKRRDNENSNKCVNFFQDESVSGVGEKRRKAQGTRREVRKARGTRHKA